MSVPVSYYPPQGYAQPVTSTSAPSVGVGRALGNYFIRAFDFTGRASRIEFWAPWVLFLIPFTILRALLTFLDHPDWFWAITIDYGWGSTLHSLPIDYIIWFILFFPFISLSIRRIRDSIASTALIIIPFLLTLLGAISFTITFGVMVDWDFEGAPTAYVVGSIIAFFLAMAFGQNYGVIEGILEIKDVADFAEYWPDELFAWYVVSLCLFVVANIVLLIFMALPSKHTDAAVSTTNTVNAFAQGPVQAQGYAYGTPAATPAATPAPAPTPAPVPAQPAAPAPAAADPIMLELNNPQTSALRLQEIASQQANNPQYRAGLLAHPNMYPELAQWLRALP